jgi:hypothetical protein
MNTENNQQLGSYFTPLNDTMENCERTYAELRIYSGVVNPNEVTRLLEIEPTSVVVLGERKRIRDTERERVGTVNGWFLSSEPNVQSTDLRRHLDWLCDELDSRTRAIRALQAQEGVHMNVTCIWWSKYGGGGPVLWPNQMSCLASLNLECSFDFQFYGEEDAEETKG